MHFFVSTHILLSNFPFLAHKCQYCERAFTQSGDLNKHLRLHVGENTYKCNLCDKSFRLQMDLRKHSYEHFQNKVTNDTDDWVIRCKCFVFNRHNCTLGLVNSIVKRLFVNTCSFIFSHQNQISIKRPFLRPNLNLIKLSVEVVSTLHLNLKHIHGPAFVSQCSRNNDFKGATNVLSQLSLHCKETLTSRVELCSIWIVSDQLDANVQWTTEDCKISVECAPATPRIWHIYLEQSGTGWH